jgi:hypothetical protein
MTKVALENAARVTELETLIAQRLSVLEAGHANLVAAVLPRLSKLEAQNDALQIQISKLKALLEPGT